MSNDKKGVVKSYILYSEHIAVITQVAEDGGQSSLSAGLRRIIREWRAINDACTDLVTVAEATEVLERVLRDARS